MTSYSISGEVVCKPCAWSAPEYGAWTTGRIVFAYANANRPSTLGYKTTIDGVTYTGTATFNGNEYAVSSSDSLYSYCTGFYVFFDGGEEIHMRLVEGAVTTVTALSLFISTPIPTPEFKVDYTATPLWATFSNGTLNLFTSDPNA